MMRLVIDTNRSLDHSLTLRFSIASRKLSKRARDLNIELKIGVGRGDKSHILFGMFFDKSINNIEKSDQDFSQETPVELKYPLGTLKDYNYDVLSDRVSGKMKLESLALRLGYSYKLFN